MGRKGIIRRLFRNRKDCQLFEDIVVNDDVTAPAGCNQVVRRVLREFDLDIVMESLKRNLGVSMMREVFRTIDEADIRKR